LLSEKVGVDRPSNFTIMLEPTDYHRVIQLYNDSSDVSVVQQYVATKFDIKYSFNCETVSFSKNLSAVLAVVYFIWPLIIVHMRRKI
jgi:hypothetical protein